MSEGSNIGWLAAPGYVPASWNPLRAQRSGEDDFESKRGWACERISPGCERCYAETLNGRLGTGEKYRVAAPVDHFLDLKALAKPLSWRAPHMVFPCSMTDLFGAWVPDDHILALFGIMAATPQHRYVVLTKRIERAAKLLLGLKAKTEPQQAMHEALKFVMGYDNKKRPGIGGEVPWPLPNVLIGPSVENQEYADKRMPHAMALAKIGWKIVVSYEPALGPVNWTPYLFGDEDHGVDLSREAGSRVGACVGWTPPISWLIVGAESGADRRPFANYWIPLNTEGVALFVKQGSAFKPGQRGDIPDDVWKIKEFPE